MIKESMQKMIDGTALTYEESTTVMKEIMSGEATNAQIGAFLTALRIKGETSIEITGFTTIMKECCNQIHPRVKGRLVDTCGTGGDKIKTFNISTIAAFVVAGADISVAKHGNRSVTSKCGSADVLEELGLNLNLEPKNVKKSIEEVGVGFMFAPAFHPAMKYAIGPRRELGIRTVFNVLGPLTNPADANAQLLGVYDAKLTEPLANSLKNLGSEEAMVVHGLNGLDEISTIGKTRISWLRNNKVTNIEMAPKDFGVKQAKLKDIEGVRPEQSADLMFKLLYGMTESNDPKRDIVQINGAAAIIVGGKADDFGYGIELAKEAIENGKAYQKLKELVKFSGGDLTKLEELETKYV
ncbi:MAG: anthranilate phosphoribosyltransferase [Candidatus Bathyarchaeota archaeon]|nr:anthranilate phosphoribosyltransferase [Candidatus Bathyarchaeum tardum]WGM89679.1 MAG: anthranilate phosphoribosyltransferase [Candidatus Bathyarchaeum tardum]